MTIYSAKAAAKNSIAQLVPVKSTGRVMRKPSHSFALRNRPNQIQPFYIAPVFPGETLKNLLVQSRVIADPVKNPLVGWWNEQYFFYVKLTDLQDSEALKNMLVTNASVEALKTPFDMRTYHPANGINYTSKALELITKWYFRDEDETVLQGAIDGIPLARSDSPGWLNSAKTAAQAGENQHEFPGENTALPAHMSAFADHYAQWEAMTSMSLTTATFEDYLEAYGINVPREELEDKKKPELVRYIRSWAYPTATTKNDGSAGVAPQWSMAERADKDRFFREPGFLFGVTVTRPKVYFGRQTGSLTHHLTDAFSWLPATLREDVYTSLKKFTGGASGVGPLGANVDADYWVDMRDLAIHGDQFINFDRTWDDASIVALPDAAMNKRYPTAAMVDGLFANAAFNEINHDGIVTTSILGALSDTTPG